MRPMRGLTAPPTLLLFALLLGPAPLAAQQGTIAGTVTDGGSGRPLPDVQVQVLSAGGQSSGSITTLAGQFRVPVVPGTYTIVATMIGYEERRLEGVQVAAGQATNVPITLISTAIALDPIQVTASRGVQERQE